VHKIWVQDLAKLHLSQFYNSQFIPQAYHPLFLDRDSEYEDYTSDSDDDSENILDKFCGEDASDMSDKNFTVGWMERKKRFADKKASNYEKNS